jgi:hypothetical protein
MGVPGLEPGTSVLSGLRSNQLSYTPLASLRKSKRALSKTNPYGVNFEKIFKKSLCLSQDSEHSCATNHANPL